MDQGNRNGMGEDSSFLSEISMCISMPQGMLRPVPSRSSILKEGEPAVEAIPGLPEDRWQQLSCRNPTDWQA